MERHGEAGAVCRALCCPSPRCRGASSTGGRSARPPSAPLAFIVGANPAETTFRLARLLYAEWAPVMQCRTHMARRLSRRQKSIVKWMKRFSDGCCRRHQDWSLRRAHIAPCGMCRAVECCCCCCCGVSEGWALGLVPSRISHAWRNHLEGFTSTGRCGLERCGRGGYLAARERLQCPT